MKRWIDEPHLEGDEAKAKALLDRVEEPRSMPIARARVWARLDSPRAKDRSLAWVALVGGLAGASAVGLVMVDRTSKSSLTLVEAIGVDVDARTASAGIELDDASVVRVSSSGRARLIGAPLGAITLSPSTNVTLIGVEAGRLALSQGRIDRLDGEPAWVSVDAGSFTVEANGRFWLARIGDDIEIEVQGGQAKVVGPGRALTLSPGGRFTSRSPSSAAVVEPKAPSTETGSPSADDAPIDRDESPAVSVETAAVERTEPRRGARSSPARAPSPLPEATSAGATEPGAPKEGDTPPIPVVRSSVEARSVPVSSEPDWAELYRVAQRERIPARAIPLFDAIADGPSAYAEVAGHQAARLVMRQGRSGEAIGRFEALLRRFPAGSYVPEGQLNVIECRLISGDLEGASRALDRFLASNPGSERTAELVRMRDELRRRNKK